MRITASDNDARAGIGAMDFPHGVARLRIGGSRDGAGVQHHDIGSGVIIEHFEPIGTQRATQRSSVCFRGAAAKIFEGKRSHKMDFKAGQESLE